MVGNTIGVALSVMCDEISPTNRGNGKLTKRVD